MIAIRNYEPGDRDITIKLLAEGRTPRYAAAKDAVFDWQYFGNPHGGEDAPFIIGTVGGEVVAVNGFMPVHLCYEGKPQPASWSTDMHVSSKFRGRGFGKALLNRVSERAPVMLAYGISPMSDPIFAKLQWILHPALRLLYFHANEPGIKGLAKNLRTRLAQLRNLDRRSHRLEITRHEDDFGPEVEDLWQRSAASYFSCVTRDAAYLTWKYRRHPIHRYEWFAARAGGQLRGLLVARYAPTTSLLVDYCGPAADSDTMAALTGAAVEVLAARGTARVQCETTHRPMLSALERCGFTTSRFHSGFRVRTNLPDDTRQVQEWLLMSGDSDSDVIVGEETPTPAP